MLAAILFPVFARVRENARRASCQSNMKQIGLGIAQYTQDYDERLPQRRFANPTTPVSYYSWKVALHPYIKSRQVWICPSNPHRLISTADSNVPGEGAINTSYGPNCAYNSDPGTNPSNDLRKVAVITDNGNGSAPILLSQIPQTSRVILMVEQMRTGNNNSWSDFNILDPGNHNGTLFTGHLGEGNFLFVDGHVKALKPLATIPASAGGTGDINMWHRDNLPFQNVNGKTPIAWSKQILTTANDTFN